MRRAQALRASPLSARHARFARIDALALTALAQELACPLKPGLISPQDRGAHSDMDSTTLVRSIAALRGCFAELAEAGSDGARFAELAAIGRAAEVRMLRATDGRNTHRGAIFSLGLLAAAAGHLHAARPSARLLCTTVGREWGAEIMRAAPAGPARTHGDFVRCRYRAPGAREQAAAGFPVALEHALPALRAARPAGLKRASLHALYAIVLVLEDNNLLYRGGEAGLAFARAEARRFMEAGGMLQPQAWARAAEVHGRFVARNLSPGGAADLLAATLFIDACERQGWQPCE
jgi:triphosphoribosyl-dephospho-CoA synthase